MLDRHRVVRGWGKAALFVLASLLLSLAAGADPPCGKSPNLWLPPDGTVGLEDGGVSVQETSGDVCQGGQVTITVTVDNQSCGDAGPFDVSVYYGGANLIGTEHVDGLVGCDYTVLTFTWDTGSVPPGTYEIGACADSKNDVAELIETDNCLTIDTDLHVRPNTPLIEAEKTAVSDAFTPGGIVRYEVTIRNDGCADQPDNPGHEFTDTLPGGLSATGYATATGGTIAVNGDEIAWDGEIPGGTSVTLVFKAKIDDDVADQTEICNQGIVRWDSDGNGTNDSDEPTDDPGTPADDDPTCFTVEIVTGPLPLSGTIDAPTMTEWGMILLPLLLGASFWSMVRRRRAASRPTGGR